MAVENISYYARPARRNGRRAVRRGVCREAQCSLLLDVNNVYVNAKNHGFDPRDMIAKMPLDRVVQIHVAGHDESDPRVIIDTHAEPVKNEVYDLLAWTLERGPVPVLLERDDNFPPWDELCGEIAGFTPSSSARSGAPRCRGPREVSRVSRLVPARACCGLLRRRAERERHRCTRGRPWR